MAVCVDFRACRASGMEGCSSGLAASQLVLDACSVRLTPTTNTYQLQALLGTQLHSRTLSPTAKQCRMQHSRLPARATMEGDS